MSLIVPNPRIFRLPLLESAEDEEKVVTTGEVDEATDGAGAQAPSEVQRLQVTQKQEKIQLQQRQANELMAAKLRDVQQKAREAQMKATQPKGAAKPSTPTR